MRLSQLERAEIIAALQRMEEERQRILDVLLPPDEDEVDEAGGCSHPNDTVEDVSTFDQERYRCTTCGAEFDHHPRSFTPQE